MASLLAVVVLFAAPVAAVHSHPKDVHSKTLHAQPQPSVATSLRTLASIPMVTLKDHCRGSSISIAELAQRLSKHRINIPGDGLLDSEFEPFKKMLQDGFMEAGCFQDYMFTKGDKFGKHKTTYDIEDTSNVSIVLYKDHVSPPEPMSQKVCFNFCRTVPGMRFFGLLHGRDCYCTPFFKQEAGDSSSCDAVCEGKNTQMCGGMSKSGLFAMHLCANTAEDLENAMKKAEELAGMASGVGEEALSSSKDLEASATELLKTFGKAGDPTAADLQQAAIEWAGKFEKMAKKTIKLGEKLDKLKGEADGMKGNEFSDYDEVMKAEAVISDMGETSDKLEKSLETTIAGFGKVIGKKIKEEYKPKEEEEDMEEEEPKKEEEGKGEEEEPLDMMKLFMPVMFFVDSEYKEVPSTCGGDLLGSPFVGAPTDCAEACEVEGDKCAGFSFFEADNSICFLFTKLKSVTYYTKCGGGKKEFLQVTAKKASPESLLALDSSPSKVAEAKAANATKARPPSPFALAMRKKRSALKRRMEKSKKEEGEKGTMCYAKFSLFSGTTLKPDPSGKCKLCLKTADKAQRCFK